LASFFQLYSKQTPNERLIKSSRRVKD
jgi:hypothetical protein